MSLLAPTKLQARVASTHYHAGNLLAGTNATFYDIRDTVAKRFNIGMARDGVIDAGIAINHDLTAGGVGVDVLVQIVALIDLSAVGGSANSASTVLWFSRVGVDDLASGSRVWFLPDASTGTATATVRQVTIPELRAPIDGLQVYVLARTAPDAGSLNLRVNRRY